MPPTALMSPQAQNGDIQPLAFAMAARAAATGEGFGKGSLRMAGTGFANSLEARGHNAGLVILAVDAILTKATRSKQLLKNFILVLSQIGNGLAELAVFLRQLCDAVNGCHGIGFHWD